MDDATSPEVAACLAALDDTARERVQSVRDVVHRLAPDSVESFTYQMVGYQLHGRPLVYVGGFAAHTGLYALPVARKAFAADVASYEQGRGSVQLPHAEPPPHSTSSSGSSPSEAPKPTEPAPPPSTPRRATPGMLSVSVRPRTRTRGRPTHGRCGTGALAASFISWLVASTYPPSGFSAHAASS
ncbi:iron chaperone [Nocardioides acrostichi]|uniref:YdhG-like domain-containing protein n=1 Tax=Nocardioides acrostichi TaxID=2784339 RepID=A0A930UYA6_9ACTN|nr:DUF1801 domain-containing protein [Nocardioides acrostichi]MBF4160337.1 hypothetical protein [Nocardioides acrostichi]